MVWSQIFTRKELNSFNESQANLSQNETRPNESSISVKMLNTIDSSPESCSQNGSLEIKFLKSVAGTPQNVNINNLKRSLSTSSESSEPVSVSTEEDKSSKKLKTDSLESLLSCKVCNKVFDCPVTLPCGDTLCHHHIDNAAESFYCCLCHKHFPGSSADIAVNKIIQGQIDMELNKLNFGASFSKAKLHIENLEKEINRVQSYQSCYFDELKNKYAELKHKTVEEREAKKRSIDEEYENILSDLDDQETESYEVLKKSLEDIRSISDKIDSYRNTLQSLEPDEKKWNDITLDTRFYNFKLALLENGLKTSFLTAQSKNDNEPMMALKSGFGLNECELSKKASANYSSSDEGFHVFKFENFKNFLSKESVESTEQFQVNNTKWYLEFGNNKGLESNCYDVYLCYICSDVTKIVEVDFLFEFIDVKNPRKNKMLKIPLLPFSYNNDSWSFSVKKEIVDRFYDAESDSIKFAFYIKPILISVEKESRYNFE